MPNFSSEWESVNCHLCGRGQNQAEPVLLSGAPLTTGQFGFEIHPVICPCGLVYLNPRWTAERYDEFYTHRYDALYRLEIKPDYGKEGVRKHMSQVWERIKPILTNRSPVKTVLDAGCGSGHGLGYLKEELPDIDIFGIEASAECCRILQEEVGATLLGRDINGRWLADNQRRFDLIIMRHVAEHFLTPIESLNRLRGTLANGGLIYIAVPDMMHPRTVLRDYDKWWEYWFRTVHTHYYSKETLFATLAKVGLSPLAWGEDNQEVWCLADTTAPPWPPENNLFTAQSRLLTQLLPTT